MSSSKTHGNMADVARRLGISRQAVTKLIRNRDRTGAPEATLAGYDLEHFAVWYAQEFSPQSGPRRGIRAKTNV